MRDYGSHIEPLNILASCVADVVHSVVELGSGLYSTPMWCNLELWPHIANIVSYEDDISWRLYFDDMFDEPRLKFTDSLPDVDFADVILIDNGNKRQERIAGIKHVIKQKTNGVVILHDADDVDYIEFIKPYFRHQIIFTGAFPHTAILWNDEKWTAKIKAGQWNT